MCLEPLLRRPSDQLGRLDRQAVAAGRGGPGAPLEWGFAPTDSHHLPS